MAFQRVMDAAQLGEGGLAQVEVDGADPICLGRVGESVFAVQHSCSHAEYPLADGTIEGECELECLLHGARFDLRTGAVLQGPATEPLKTYRVKLEDGGIWVDPG